LGAAAQQHLLSAAAQQRLLLAAQLEPSAGLHRLVLALVLLSGHLLRAQGLLLLPVLLPVLQPPRLGAACLAAHPLASRPHQPALLLRSQVLLQPRVAPLPYRPMLSSEQQSRLQYQVRLADTFQMLLCVRCRLCATRQGYCAGRMQAGTSSVRTA
jgi:hypothetical protein